MRRRAVPWGALAFGALIVAAGCGSSTKNGFPPGTDAGTSAGDAGLVPGDGGVLTGDGSSAVPCSGNHCSSDLRGVVDCNGNTVMTCPASEGCGAGTTCVPACEAAKESKGSIGCEFYAVDPDIITGLGGGAGGCFAAYIANTWDTAITLTADFAGSALDPSKFAYIPTGSGGSIQFAPIANGSIPAGEVAILFLADLPGANDGTGPITCPAGVSTAVTSMDAATHGTGIGSAFHLSVTAPVAAYDIFPFGGGQSAMTSATLLLPTSAWDTNYIAVDAFGSGVGPLQVPFLEMVAQQDGTTITINPKADIMAGTGVAAAPKGTPATYMLGKGQMLQFTQDAALEGSVIQSNNPIGLWGGQTTLSIAGCCDDSAHQQIPPVQALGSEYVGVRYRNRYTGTEESPPWRIIGAAKGTTLTWEPVTPAGAPTTLDLGQVAQWSSNGPFVVRSQDASHPFYMSAHMTGGSLYDPSQNGTGAADGRGDAEFVNVIPPDEYLDSYVFFTDPTYPETDLVVVRTKGPSGFPDVDLDCAGTLSGWQPIGTSGKYEYTRFDLVTGNFQGTGKCNNGRHVMKSKLPVGLTVWGWGSAATGQQGQGFYTQYVSYAYPGGASVAPINKVVIPPTTQ